MRYRVAFKVFGGGLYYSEWFDTFEEAHLFIADLDTFVKGVHIRHIEYENHNIV